MFCICVYNIIYYNIYIGSKTSYLHVCSAHTCVSLCMCVVGNTQHAIFDLTLVKLQLRLQGDDMKHSGQYPQIVVNLLCSCLDARSPQLPTVGKELISYQ